MTQYNLRTRLELNLFSGHFDKAGTVLASRYAHSSCVRMTRGAKTGYTTRLTSVTSPNSWTTHRAYSTGFWHDFFGGFSFLSIFACQEKPLLSGYFTQWHPYRCHTWLLTLHTSNSRLPTSSWKLKVCWTTKWYNCLIYHWSKKVYNFYRFWEIKYLMYTDELRT